MSRSSHPPRQPAGGPGRRPRAASGRPPAAAAGRGTAPRRKPAVSSSSGSAPKATQKPAQKTAALRPVSASHSTGLLPQYTPARTARPVISQTSAQRFAAKVRARRRRRVLSTFVVLLVLGGAGWLTVLSPWAKVNRVSVSGLDRIPAGDVRSIADAELGHSLLLARTSDVAAQVQKLRLVKSVQVHRAWPGTLKVQVTEREPVAALPAGSVLRETRSADPDAVPDAATPVAMTELVDDEGVVIETVAAKNAPAGLPRIEVALGEKQSVENLRGTLAVLNALPHNLRSRLKAIGAQSPDGIWLRLSAPLKTAAKRTVLVQWGDSAQGGQKAEVLTALLKQKAKTYDVRAPEMPSTTS